MNIWIKKWVKGKFYVFFIVVMFDFIDNKILSVIKKLWDCGFFFFLFERIFYVDDSYEIWWVSEESLGIYI